MWAITQRTKASIMTERGPRVDRGYVRAVRWEHGIGKGRWRKALLAVHRDRLGDLDGSLRIRRLYLVVSSRYKLEYAGTPRGAQEIYEAAR